MFCSFPNITPQQVVFFLKNYCESKKKDVAFLRSKYENHNIGFTSVLEFMNKMNFIEILDNKLLISEELRNRLGDNFININEVLLDGLLITPNQYSAEIEQFFQSVIIGADNSVININHYANNLYSNFRNFLIHLGLFNFNAIEKTYLINPDLIYFIIEFINDKNSISPNALFKIQADEKSLGDMAELEILNFEKNRLKAFPYLLDKIKHVASYNSAAGYDIRSFELPSDTSGKIVPRYIEVKAVSLMDYSFYISSGELAKATILKEKYYLYLLPVKTSFEFIIEKLKFVQNPSKTLFIKDIWTSHIQKYNFFLNNLTRYES